MKERKKYSLDHFNKSALNGGNSFMAKKEFNFDNSFKTQTGLWYKIYRIPLCYISISFNIIFNIYLNNLLV